MGVRDYLEVLMLACSITAVLVVGRNNIKKQIITDLQALVLSHQLTIDQLTKDLAASKAREAQKDERIAALEDIIDGRPNMVRQGHHSGSGGSRGRNRPATP